MNTLRMWVRNIGMPFRQFLPAPAASAVGWVTVFGIAGVAYNFVRRRVRG